MPPATLTRQRTTFALPLQPQAQQSAPLDCPSYLHPTPAVVRVSLRSRAAAVIHLAIVAISCLLHVKYCILSTLQRRDETMLCAVLPFLLRRRNSIPPLCLVRLQRCPHG
jgi:hypothetical protein